MGETMIGMVAVAGLPLSLPPAIKRMRDRLSARGSTSSDSPPLLRHGTASLYELSEGSGCSGEWRRDRRSSQRTQETVSISSAEEAAYLDDPLPVQTKSPFVNAIQREVRWFFLDIVDAFERKEVNVISNDKGEEIRLVDEKTSLSVLQLRRDLRRLFAAAHPLIEAAAGLHDLLLWKNPIASLLLTIVYMYSIWIGYFWMLIFLLILLQLSLNYAYTIRGVDVGLNFLPRKEVKMPKLDMSAGQLLIDVAKLAQQLVKFGADFLEKLESLFTWKEPRVTLHFFCLVVYWLAWSVYFSIGTCFGACAMTFGIRLFITTFLFDKFPRLRYRLDTFGYFYRNLPLKSGEIPVRPLSTDARSFPSSLSLRPSRSVSMDRLGPVEGDESSMEGELVGEVLDHRRCIMAERERSFPRSHASGLLLLTPDALVFRGEAGAERLLPLDSLLAVRAVVSTRSLSLLTGTRKGMEVEMEDEEGRQKTSFVGVPRRDEFMDLVERTCRHRGRLPQIVRK